MLRRFIAQRIQKNNSGDGLDNFESYERSHTPRVPPPNAFTGEFGRHQEIDSTVQKVEELAPFDTCVEACDALAASSTSSGRNDPVTGLVDCSVLVSADGELLIIPQEQSTKELTPQPNEDDDKTLQTPNVVQQRIGQMLGEEYASAVFMGNDLLPAGDKALNGFAAKGWSIPAASLAMKQTQDDMSDLAEFVEHLVLTKKESAARESQVVDRLRSMVDAPELGPNRAKEYQAWVKEIFPDVHLEVLSTRVGPLSSQGGTVNATLVALENYYSTIAESDSNRWREATQQMGLFTKLRNAQAQTNQRAMNRQMALQAMFQKAKAMEDHLAVCKEESARRWDAVNDAEVTVTKLVEEKMLERSRMREQQRLGQLKKEEESRARNSANGNFGATSSEIWDIVSAVTASMDEGSFEPMDLPQAPLSVPRDQSRSLGSGDLETSGDESEDDVQSQLPVASRHELEQKCRLPELRVAAMAADEAVEDASNNLLNVLSNFDTTNRSARIAAETCLVSACNAQASCIDDLIKIERAAIEERMRHLQELEKAAQEVDVRADMNHYITLDKKERGGQSFLGDDDDGGVASALAVLNSHIEGNMGLGSAGKFNAEGWASTSNDDDDSTSPELLGEAVDAIFEDIPLLKADAPDDQKTAKVQNKFQKSVAILCKAGSDRSPAARSRRSTICYALNAKRSNRAEIWSPIQFDGLCKVFISVLSGCDTEGSGVALAKMCMMLSQTFYMVEGGSEEDIDSRSNRVYVKTRLVDHPLWEKDEYW
jgi:hypothetical protein